MKHAGIACEPGTGEAAAVFPWPCHRRDAHGEHRVVETEKVAGTTLLKSHGRTCPGVEAHPATMAGGSWKAW